MSEAYETDDPGAAQTDRESQEFGAAHGQDLVTREETGSSSPTAEGSEQAELRGEKTDENQRTNRSTPAD
jgi:hypothetical protein